eukprot:2112340-Prymnesium_polylepis.1
MLDSVRCADVKLARSAPRRGTRHVPSAIVLVAGVVLVAAVFEARTRRVQLLAHRPQLLGGAAAVDADDALLLAAEAAVEARLLGALDDLEAATATVAAHDL